MKNIFKTKFLYLVLALSVAGGSFIIPSASAESASAEKSWRSAVRENYDEGAILGYSLYDSTVEAEVSVTSACPNDDNTEWNINGVEYKGKDYGGSEKGGIAADITDYLNSGDKLKLSFDYRSSYDEVEPFIEVRHPDMTATQYFFDTAPSSGTWTSYSSDESEEIYFDHDDTVMIVLKNRTGYWHIKALDIQRYGFEQDKNYNIKEWRSAVIENYDSGAKLNYTVYDGTDSGTVSVTSACPNDSNTEWNINGVQYVGINYWGSDKSGIATNITQYIDSGDKIKISFDYRSSSFDVEPFIEVRHSDMTATRYKFEIAPVSGVWTNYRSNESEEIYFDENDSVVLVLKNQTGYWHIKNLKIQRYGYALKNGFISDLNISGLENNKLTGDDVTISGTTKNGATVYGILYSGGKLVDMNSVRTDGDFSINMSTNGADKLKLFAWDDNMSPYIDEVTVTSDGSGSYREEEPEMIIKDEYAEDFLIGNVYNRRNLYGEDKDMLLRHFNVITPENIMKPEYINPYDGIYNWSDPDEMMNFAKENGLEVIGHTLVWHQQTPEHLTTGTAPEVKAKMENYISTVVGHYKGRIKGWDVVNEAVRDDIQNVPQSWNEYIRKDDASTGSDWYRAMMDDEYIYNAYVAAHNADPDAELYYNDYNLDSYYKREAVALLVEHINNKYKEEYNTDENLIDAIGMQAHYWIETDVQAVKASIERFKSIGVHVNISELDVCISRITDNGQGSGSSEVTMTEALEKRQAAKYAELMTLFKTYSDVIDRVTFWGYSDGFSWRSGLHPLMFNSDLSPKEAFYGIMQPRIYR